jgi:tRNA pseudouridine55 synthase
MNQSLPVDGVFLLDKPSGLSSNQALHRVKRLFNAQKAGHTGTLDPLATGLLPVCLGEATKFAQDLLYANKSYAADIYLGKTTATGDAEGEVLTEAEVACDLETIQNTLKKFTGSIKQTPPMYSALKKDGKPLYQYARAGQEVERQQRDVEIEQLELLQFHTPILKIQVACSKGTYIRTLAEDIGQHLQCGAYLSGLRRIAVGELALSQALTLEELEALSATQRLEKLLPIDRLVQHLLAIELTPDLGLRFLQGQRLPLGKSDGEALDLFSKVCDPVARDHDHAVERDIPRLVRVYQEDALLGLAQLDHGILRPKRLVRHA